jgi:WD40 repeat protein
LAGYDNFLVTGSWDKNGILWDLNHGKKLTTLIGHSEVINCIKIRKNTVVTASSDASLVIWNLEIENATKVDGTKYTDRFKARLLESKALIGHQSDIYC